MLRRLVKLFAFVVTSLVVIGGVLYAVGARIVLDGGGGLHIRFSRSAGAQARDVEAHRAAQRTGTPATPAPADLPAPAEAEPSAPARSAQETSSDAQEASSEEIPTAMAAPPPVTPGTWTGFRGPRRDGVYIERAIRTDWPAAGLTPLWTQPAGGGYASFAVARGRAFTIEQRGEEEVVAAYDPRTGRELWTVRWTAAFREFMGGDGPRATPTWADERVYALGAQGELRCLEETTGRVVWRTNILEDSGAANLQWGMAASPLVVRDMVIVTPGGRNGQSVVAYDRHTGARVWSALDDQAAYASPMLVTLAGVEQMLVVTASRLVGLSPDRGDLLRDTPWTTSYDINAAQPIVVGDNRVFYSSGYGSGAAVFELSHAEGRWTVREVWRNVRMKNRFASSVLHEGFLYGLDEAILACVDAGTGELRWKGGRYGYGQVVLAAGHLIVLTEDGDLALVRATPERHEEIVRFDVLDGKTWNVPALADGILLVRNLQGMAGFDVR